ncbi:hypothetical protein DPEC_G00338610 [Dallia pectoralis]|uniref:Uncharacterized protein n=1 Tax=Dallia pectoralis TaxID=75939 RepID=A0ACC2F4N4_DALPE|nr:hypothetical protein DPEC_G00338610 [Dallia pectoralis]
MSSSELSAPDADSGCIRTFKEHMHLELELPRAHTGHGAGIRGATSPKLSPRSSPRLFRRLMVSKPGIRHRRRFTVAHTWGSRGPARRESEDCV